MTPRKMKVGAALGMRNQNLRAHVLVLLAGVTALSAVARAGVLMPPAGPVIPTMKTLSDVEPRTAVNATNTPGDADSLFKIAQPGSYYLTGNITGIAGKIGIELAASGVTLDLNGFDLVGVPSSNGGVVVSVAGTHDIAVVNGAVRNWTAGGVFLGGVNNTRLTDLLVGGNNFFGIRTGDNAVVTGCIVYDNALAGLSVESSAVITNCSAYANRSGPGIRINGRGCTITNCSAYSNTGGGIIETISAVGNTITDCSAHANTGDGIHANYGNTITNCSATLNTGHGIAAEINSMITKCTTSSNTLDGIRVKDQCSVRDNTCASNGFGAGDGAGVHVTGFDNRIEGNDCTINDRGIDVDIGGNFITRNTCADSTISNWDVVAGNVCLVVSAAAGAAIVGNSGGVAPGSTDPNANFTY